MASKQILYSDDARQKMKKGIETLARAVKTTLGATGRNVMFEKSFGSPTITKDGVTVAKEVELPDPFENMGAKMVKEIASKTSDVAGDGTTTATILAEAIYTWRGTVESGEPEEAPTTELLELSDGDRVRHGTFGDGVVVSRRAVNGDFELVVAFDGAGVKKLLQSFARLEKMP